MEFFTSFNFYGVTIPELVRFLAQVGLSIMGAAALWGMVFTWRAKKLDGDDKGGAYALGSILMQVLLGGAVLFTLAWWFEYLVVFAEVVGAHEGITIRDIPEAFL